jgi:oxygen-independent coproporphyrinogen III oxidase
MDAAPRLAAMEADGLIGWNGRQIDVTQAGRPFVRAVAASFDTYLAADSQRHARAV